MPAYRVLLEESTAYEVVLKAPSPEWAEWAALELDEEALRYLEPELRTRRVKVEREEED